MLRASSGWDFVAPLPVGHCSARRLPWGLVCGGWHQCIWIAVPGYEMCDHGIVHDVFSWSDEAVE